MQMNQALKGRLAVARSLADLATLGPEKEEWAENVANAAVSLASPLAETIAGRSLVMDGGGTAQ